MAGIGDGDALGGERHADVDRLGAEFVGRVALEAGVFEAGFLEPGLPPGIAGADDGEFHEVGGVFQRAFRRECRAQERREIHAHHLVGVKPRPVAGAPADRDIDGGAGKIDHLLRGREPDGDLRMADLESAEIARQPLLGEGGGGVDDKRVMRRRAQRLDGFVEQFEPLAHLGQQPFARLRQRHLPRAAEEQRLADILLQKLDLVADGRLRHAELLAGAGEAQVPRHRLEDAQRIQRELAGEFHA